MQLFPGEGEHYLTRRPGMSEDPAPQGYAELSVRVTSPLVWSREEGPKIQYMPLIDHGAQERTTGGTVHVLRGGNLLRLDLVEGGAVRVRVAVVTVRVIGQTKTKYDDV